MNTEKNGPKISKGVRLEDDLIAYVESTAKAGGKDWTFSKALNLIVWEHKQAAEEAAAAKKKETQRKLLL